MLALTAFVDAGNANVDLQEGSLVNAVQAVVHLVKTLVAEGGRGPLSTEVSASSSLTTLTRLISVCSIELRYMCESVAAPVTAAPKDGLVAAAAAINLTGVTEEETKLMQMLGQVSLNLIHI